MPMQTYYYLNDVKEKKKDYVEKTSIFHFQRILSYYVHVNLRNINDRY